MQIDLNSQRHEKEKNTLKCIDMRFFHSFLVSQKRNTRSYDSCCVGSLFFFGSHLIPSGSLSSFLVFDVNLSFPPFSCCWCCFLCFLVLYFFCLFYSLLGKVFFFVCSVSGVFFFSCHWMWCRRTMRVNERRRWILWSQQIFYLLTLHKTDDSSLRLLCSFCWEKMHLFWISLEWIVYSSCLASCNSTCFVTLSIPSSSSPSSSPQASDTSFSPFDWFWRKDLKPLLAHHLVWGLEGLFFFFADQEEGRDVLDKDMRLWMETTNNSLGSKRDAITRMMLVPSVQCSPRWSWWEYKEKSGSWVETTKGRKRMWFEKRQEMRLRKTRQQSKRTETWGGRLRRKNKQVLCFLVTDIASRSLRERYESDSRLSLTFSLKKSQDNTETHLRVSNNITPISLATKLFLTLSFSSLVDKIQRYVCSG